MLDFRAEFFNLWNHPHLYLPGSPGVSNMQDINAPGSFGLANATVNNLAGDSRVIQFALKLVFLDGLRFEIVVGQAEFVLRLPPTFLIAGSLAVRDDYERQGSSSDCSYSPAPSRSPRRAVRSSSMKTAPVGGKRHPGVADDDPVAAS